MQSGILGDISPKPGTEDHVASKKDSGGAHEDLQSMVRSTTAPHTRARVMSPKG